MDGSDVGLKWIRRPYGLFLWKRPKQQQSFQIISATEEVVYRNSFKKKTLKMDICKADEKLMNRDVIVLMHYISWE